MTFIIKIDAADAGNAAAKIGDVESSLEKTTAASDKTRDSLSKLGKDGVDAGTAITRGAQEATTGVERLKALIGGLNTEIEHTRSAVEGTGRSMADWTTQMEREAAILERIRGPMREYRADLDSLDSMLAKGVLSQSEYSAEMDRLIKKQGTMQGAKQEFSAQAAAPAPTAPNLGTNALAIYASSQILMGGAQMFAGFVQGLHDVEDVSIRATNAAQKFVDAGHSVSDVMHEQLVVAESMHASYTTTIALYNKVREGSEGVALSHREQLQLTQTLGEAVQVSNKPVEEAASLMSKFAFAMQTGTIQTRELRNIMREVPAITDVWRSSFHATNAEIMDMVKTGQLSIADLVGALTKVSPAMDTMHAKFATLSRTNEQVLSEFKEHVAILNGNSGTSALEGMLNVYGPWLKETETTTGTIAGAISNFVTNIDDAKAAAERLNQASMRGVAAEIEKLNDPADKARLEVDALNKAFSMGAVDLDQYNKEYDKLLTTMQHGRQSEAFKINLPIADAKASMADLNKAFNNDDIDFAQYQKRFNELQSQIHGGILPETEKLMTPIDEAKRALTDLNLAVRQHRVDSELARVEADRLMTTINDGRLPEVIKIWESLHLPQEQFQRDMRAGSALLDAGRISIEEYRVEMQKLAETAGNGDIWRLLDQHIKPIKIDSQASDFASDQARAAHQKLIDSKMDELDKQYSRPVGNSEFEKNRGAYGQPDGPDLAADTAAFDKRIENRAALGKATYALDEVERQHALVMQSEHSIMQQILDPQKQYAAGLEAAGKLLADHTIDAVQYGRAVDKITGSYLANSDAGKTFMGGLEAGWIKLKGEADAFGSTIATTLLGDVDKLNAALVSAANGGQVSWSNLFDTILQGLEQVLLKAIEVAAVTSLLNAIEPGLGSAAAGTGVAGAAVGSANQATSAPSTATVARTAPGAYPMPSPTPPASAAAMPQSPVVVEIHNHFDESVAHAAMQSTKGRQILQNIQRADNPALRR
jgi:hypothetical protein